MHQLEIRHAIHQSLTSNELEWTKKPFKEQLNVWLKQSLSLISDSQKYRDERQNQSFDVIVRRIEEILNESDRRIEHRHEVTRRMLSDSQRETEKVIEVASEEANHNFKLINRKITYVMESLNDIRSNLRSIEDNPRQKSKSDFVDLLFIGFLSSAAFIAVAIFLLADY